MGIQLLRTVKKMQFNKKNQQNNKKSKEPNPVITEKDTNDMHKPVRGLQKQ